MSKRFLIIQTASLGDVILTTPILEKIHHHYPDARIDFLLKYGYEGIFRKHPYIHHVIVWDKTEKKYKRLAELIRLVREHHYDAVINVHRFASSGLITALSGAKIRAGFNKNPFSVFFTHRVKHAIGKTKEHPHEVSRNLSLTGFIGNANDDSLFRVKLYPSKHDVASVSQYKTKQYITIAPASLWFTKQFPEDKWIHFMQQLDSECVVYLLGSGTERELCDHIIAASGHKNSLNLAGKLNLLESAALMKNALMNYVNDSAPMHMASAVNAKTTAVYCSTVPEYGFGPLSDISHIVQAVPPPECKPCGLHGFKKCPKKHFKCSTEIKTEQLLETL